MHGPICTNNKSSVNKLVDLFHIWPIWPYLWHWPWISKVKSWNCHIYQIFDPIEKKDKKEWILWMVWYIVDNIWPTFCFHRMLQCRSGVSFLSLATSVWSYLYLRCDVYLSNLLHLFNNIWNADRLMEGYTIWARAKMEHSRRMQYCISIQQWKAMKIGRNYWNR